MTSPAGNPKGPSSLQVPQERAGARGYWRPAGKPWAERPGAFPPDISGKKRQMPDLPLWFSAKPAVTVPVTVPVPVPVTVHVTVPVSLIERQKTLCADSGTHRLLRRGRRLPPVWDRTRQSAPPGIPRARPACRSRRSGRGHGGYWRPAGAVRGRQGKPGPSGRPGTRPRVGRERQRAFGQPAELLGGPPGGAGQSREGGFLRRGRAAGRPVQQKGKQGPWKGFASRAYFSHPNNKNPAQRL